MSARNSIRNRRGRKKINAPFELQLTSMMDVLVIIVIFLLKSYSTGHHNFTTVPGLKLPISTSQENPLDSLQVIVTPEAITFEGARVLEFRQTASAIGTGDATYTFDSKDLDKTERNLRIIPLYDALLKAREKSEILRRKSKARDEQGNPLPFDGAIAIQADKRIQYDTIRRIMYTAAAAGYKTVRFIALKQET